MAILLPVSDAVLCASGRSYVLGDVLGAGGFGFVHACEAVGQQFAAKVSKLPLCIGGPSDSLLQEAPILGQRQHPHILRMIDAALTRAYPMIIVELMERSDLFKVLLSRKRFSAPEVSHMVPQLMGAIDYVHSVNIAHRDVKPENMLVESTTAQGVSIFLSLKLSDFGSAEATQGGVVFSYAGSPPYMAPEVQALRLQPGTPTDGYAADRFSMGVCVFIFLHGRFPTPKRVRASMLRLGPELEGLVDVVCGLMRKSPSKRPLLSDCIVCPWFSQW
jgi:serine/threonine protein kinase